MEICRLFGLLIVTADREDWLCWLLVVLVQNRADVAYAGIHTQGRHGLGQVGLRPRTARLDGGLRNRGERCEHPPEDQKP